MRPSLLALVAMAAALGQKPNPEYEIRAARAKSNQAIAAHDIQAYGAALADDFTSTRGNGKAGPSRQESIDSFTAMFKDSTAVRYERVTDKVEISAIATLAAEHGHWTATKPNGAKAYGGTYLAMWRKTPAGWKIRSELFVLLTCEDAPACADYTK